MEIKAKVRKFVDENKYWILGEGPFDKLLDKPIVAAFATVEYNDGEIGIINDVQSVAIRLAQTVTVDE